MIKSTGMKKTIYSPSSPSSSSSISSSITSSTTTSVKSTNFTDSRYFLGCRKDTNCGCDICLASINATIDLKLSSSSKCSSPHFPSTPISFHLSSSFTPQQNQIKNTVGFRFTLCLSAMFILLFVTAELGLWDFEWGVKWISGKKNENLWVVYWWRYVSGLVWEGVGFQIVEAVEKMKLWIWEEAVSVEDSWVLTPT